MIMTPDAAVEQVDFWLGICKCCVILLTESDGNDTVSAKVKMPT